MTPKPNLTRGAWLRLVVGLALVATGCNKDQSPSSPPGSTDPVTAEVGGPAPEIRLPSLGGSELALSELRGNVVVVDFWASWCKPCREELPALEALYQAHRAEGFVIVGINLDEERDDAMAFLEDHKVTFPIGFDPEGLTADTWKLPKMPTSYIIDSEGTIVHMHAGFETGDDEEIAAEVAELLSK